MIQIKQLTRVIIESTEDGLQTSRLPNNEEVMNKINEIVRYINYIEQKKISRELKGR